MADIITTGTSGYATGSIDTATVLVNNVSPTDAKHPNGCAAAIVQIEGILGSGTTLKGNKADLGARLAVALTADGVINATGAAAITLEDSRTTTTATPLTLTATTSGTPASGIGTQVLIRAESADENPSDIGALEFVFSDVSAGSEDSGFRVKLRRAGAALAGAWYMDCTNAFEAVLRHANTAQRIYTFQDSSDTIVCRDTTDTLTNKTLTSPTITGNTLGTGAIKTATGSASFNNVNGDVTLNDYSFLPGGGWSTGSSGTPLNLAWKDQTDPGTTVPSLYIAASGTALTYVVRWRYITASDDPTLWVAIHNITGEIKATWASDDPLPNGAPGLEVTGCTIKLLKATDLESWAPLQATAADAANRIRDKKLKMQHQAYRALQILANDEAPSNWILKNCEIKNGKVEAK